MYCQLATEFYEKTNGREPTDDEEICDAKANESGQLSSRGSEAKQEPDWGGPE